jgi:hypothetical protein
MIGAKKEEGFIFQPGEIDAPQAVKDYLKDLPDVNNEKHVCNGSTGKCRGKYLGVMDRHLTWEELFRVLPSIESGEKFCYLKDNGDTGYHLGWYKTYADKHSHVIHGTGSIFNPLTNRPLTIRERCRIQGLPDDFIIYGTKLNDQGEWNIGNNLAVLKQTGKCMPVQFCQYVSEQIAAHIKGKNFECSGQRILRENEFISNAKIWLCQQGHYLNKVCDHCGVKKCGVKGQKQLQFSFNKEE